MSELGIVLRRCLSAAGAWPLDNEGKLFGIVLGVMAIRQSMTFLERLDQYWVYLTNGIYATPLLSLAVTGLSAIYMGAIAFILFFARRPLARYEALVPNLLAVLAGFGIYVFGLLEPAGAHFAGLYFPLSLLVMGAGIVLWALLYLRRAFSVLPQARTVVQAGPYRHIRHPMYLGNIMTIIGLGLLLSTTEALLLAAALSALQVCRARYEDRLLAATFHDYGVYMSRVNAFVPRIPSRRPANGIVMLAVLIAATFPTNRVHAQSTRAKRESQCRAWHQKALAGRWYTIDEASEFAMTDGVQEDIVAIPACNDFFKLQTRCQDAAIGTMVASMESDDSKPSPDYLKAASTLLALIETTPACKSIAGVEQVCPALQTHAKQRKQLTPRQKAILGECADASIAGQTSGLIRGAL